MSTLEERHIKGHSAQQTRVRMDTHACTLTNYFFSATFMYLVGPEFHLPHRWSISCCRSESFKRWWTKLSYRSVEKPGRFSGGTNRVYQLHGTCLRNVSYTGESREQSLRPEKNDVNGKEGNYCTPWQKDLFPKRPRKENSRNVLLQTVIRGSFLRPEHIVTCSRRAGIVQWEHTSVDALRKNKSVVIPFYLQSVLVHSANCVKTYTASRRVLSSAAL
jgi:hypothetical protein